MPTIKFTETSDKNPIDVYWAPSKFTSTDAQWNMLYREPQSVINNFAKQTVSGSSILRCPATRETLRNVYSLNSNVHENIDLSQIDYQAISQTDITEPFFLNIESTVGIKVIRNTSYSGFININYNLAWMMFASEPLTVRMTAPFFPVSSPTEGAIFAVGQFDIGRWYRPMNLDYHIPIGSKKFEIQKNESLAFLEFMTDRPINFLRYELTPELEKIGEEFVHAPNIYGPKQTLLQRYQLAKTAGLPDIVLSHIRKNLI